MKAKARPAVDWKKLKTARGAASRVPALVKALAGGKSEQDRAAAVFALRQGLHADGSVAPATAPTVSLLLDVVAEGAEGAHLAAQLVGDAVSAGHLRRLAEPRAPIAGPIAEVRDAALEGKEMLLSAVDSADARVRAAAAFALAFLPELGEPARAALRRRLATETDGDARISAGLALALLCGDAPSAADDAAFQHAREATTPGARAAAALAGIVLRDSKIEGLAGAAARLAAPFAPASMPWGEGALDQAVVALAARADRRREVAVGMLQALDSAAPAAVWSAVARVALDLGEFKKSWQDWDVALPEELSEAQRAIAVELTRRSGIEGLGWGVPRSVRDRRRWLGIAPAGALEKIITVTIASGETKWPVWKVWQALGTRPGAVDFPEPILHALSADELLEAYGEVCACAYNINANRVDPPVAAVVGVLAKVTERAAAWARAFWSDMNEMLAAQAVPELGGSLGIKGTAAIYLALIARGEPLPPELHRFFPASTIDHATPRAILQLLGPKAEEVLWAWMSQPRFADATNFLVRAAMPLLDCAPSKRVAERLLAALRGSKGLPPGHPEEYLAKMRAVAATEPAVAEALG